MNKLFWKRNNQLMLLGLLLIVPAIASSQQYRAQNIPDSLLENSNVVIRKEILDFTVLNPGKGKEYNLRAVTLLNDNSEREKTLVVGYDDLRKLTSLSARIYDSDGLIVKKFKMKDFHDASAYDGFSVYSDNRLKYLTIIGGDYPYTIELEYEYELNGLMFYPSQVFNSTQGPVQSSILSISLPKEMVLRYKTQHTDEPEITESKSTNYINYKWSYSDLKQIRREPFSPPLHERYIQVRTAPDIFDFGGMRGKMDTWKGLGEFQLELNNSLDPLPKSRVDYIRTLTENVSNTREKISKVYDYLQNNFRYVGIQLGIGGWQPFSPDFVDEKGYGDCKALSFYTKSLLEAIDIEAYYTLVSAGQRYLPIDPNFPSRSFNHVILCVPNKGDTIWLECTSQTNPMGYCGTFTGDRDVLVVKPNGSEIVHTPKYGLNENTQHRVAKLSINENGVSIIRSSTRYSGLQSENNNLDFAVNYSSEEQKKWLYENIEIPSFEIRDYHFSQTKSSIPVTQLDLSIATKDILSSSGSRMFVTGNIMNKVKDILKKLENRESELFIPTTFQDVDSIWFDFPSNTEIEYIPETIELNTEYGSYSAKYKLVDDSLLYLRNFILNEVRLGREHYDKFREFMITISEYDKKMFILKKIN